MNVNDWRRRITGSDLPSRARLVALALSVRMNPSGTCWPSLTTIAADTGLARSTVAAAVQELEAGGWLTVDRSRRSNRYTATLVDNPNTTSPASGPVNLNGSTVGRGSPTIGTIWSDHRTLTSKEQVREHSPRTTSSSTTAAGPTRQRRPDRTGQEYRPPPDPNRTQAAAEALVDPDELDPTRRRHPSAYTPRPNLRVVPDPAAS